MTIAAKPRIGGPSAPQAALWLFALCPGLMLSVPAFAQINPGAISNESRRQEQRMQRDLERQWRTQTGPVYLRTGRQTPGTQEAAAAALGDAAGSLKPVEVS